MCAACRSGHIALVFSAVILREQTGERFFRSHVRSDRFAEKKTEFWLQAAPGTRRFLCSMGCVRSSFLLAMLRFIITQYVENFFGKWWKNQSRRFHVSRFFFFSHARCYGGDIRGR